MVVLAVLPGLIFLASTAFHTALHSFLTLLLGVGMGAPSGFAAEKTYDAIKPQEDASASNNAESSEHIHNVTTEFKQQYTAFVHPIAPTSVEDNDDINDATLI